MMRSETLDQLFNIGKKMLDRGQYTEAIESYDSLIGRIKDYEDHPSNQLLLEVSLNNRGYSKCKEAYKRQDQTMYECGIDDFKKAVEVSGVTNDYDLNWRTAWKNLQVAYNELQDLKSAHGKSLIIDDLPQGKSE